MSQTLLRAGAVAATLALCAVFAPANATPLFPTHGLASGASTVESVRYKRHHYRPDSVYVYNDYGSEHPAGYGSYEYRELQRQYPETNWPSSLRDYER